MASSIQILRSTTPKERPFPNTLLEGQPAVNLSPNEPGLFFKASDGSLLKIGPTALTFDGSAPNSSPAGQGGNCVGELWYDGSTSPGTLKVFDGASWLSSGSPNAITDITAGTSVAVARTGNSVEISAPNAITDILPGSNITVARAGSAVTISATGGGGGSGSFVRWIYSAIGGETSLSGTSNGVLLSYSPGLEEVFVNGVLITRNVDYTASNGSSITNLAPLSPGDVITVTSIVPASVVTLPGTATLTRWSTVATNGQTTLTGLDTFGETLSYTAGLEEVYVNGVLLRRNQDYTATNGTSVVLTTPLYSGDEVSILVWTPFTVATPVSASQVEYQSQGSATTRSLASKLTERISVRDYGAVGDGVTDDTVAFQVAIDRVSQNGGGTVYVPSPGRYLIDSNLTVYPNVLLEGDLGQPGEQLPPATAAYTNLSGVIFINSAATVTFGNCSGIKGLIVLRKGLTLPFTDNASAAAGLAAFAGTAFTVGGADVLFSNLLIIGFDTAIYGDFKERTRCEYVCGDCNNGIYLRQVFDVAHINNCHFWPYTTGHVAGLTAEKLRRPGIAYRFESFADWCKITDSFSYGYETGFYVNNCPSVTLLGCGADNTGPVILTTKGIHIAGNSIECNVIGCQAAAQGTALLLDVTKTNGTVKVVGSQFWAHDSYGIDILSGRVALTNTGIRTAPVGLRVNSTNASVSVTNCDFTDTPTPISCSGQALRESIFWGNTFNSASDTTIGQHLSYNNQLPNYTYTAYNASAQLNQFFRTSRGNTATPAAAVSGDYSLYTRGQVFNGTDFTDIAGLKFELTGTPSASSTPGSIVFSTTPSGSTSLTPRVTVKDGGQLRFQPLAAAPSSPEAGDVYYDSGLNKLRCWDGSAWNNLF